MFNEISNFRVKSNKKIAQCLIDMNSLKKRVEFIDERIDSGNILNFSVDINTL